MIVATLTMTVSYMDRTTLSVLAPSVTKALDISESAYGWLAAAFSFAYLVGTPLGGWWIDRAGARRGLVTSLLMWSIVAALHAVAPVMGVLFGLRLALGIAEGPALPGAVQVVRRALPATERDRGIGLVFAATSIGGMLAPPLASALYRAAGWRVAFLGSGLAGLAWVPLWIAMTRRADVRAALDVAPNPKQPRPPLRALVVDPVMIRALIAVFACTPVLAFFTSWGAKFLVGTFQLKQQDVGHYLWLPPLCFGAGTFMFGDLSSRLSRAAHAPPRALFAIAMVFASMIVLLPSADTPWHAMAITGVAIAGGGGLLALSTADLLSRVPPEVVAAASGTLAGAQSLAYIAVSPVIGSLVQHFHDYDAATLVLGAWVLPGSLIWLAWRPANQLRPRNG